MGKFSLEFSFPIALLFFFFLTIIQLLKLLKKPENSSKLIPPSPPKLPLIGNLHQIGELPHRSLASLAKKYGPLMLLNLGQVKTLVVSTPETAREVLHTNDHVFASRPPVKVAKLLLYDTSDFGFAAYGPFWRHARKLCTIHYFSSKMIKSYQCFREVEVGLMLQKISRAIASTDRNGFDMSEVLKSLGIGMICRVTADEFFSLERRRKMIRTAVDENVHLFSGFFFEDYFPSLGWLDRFSKLSRRTKKNVENWDQILEELFQYTNDMGMNKGENTSFVGTLLSLRSNEDMDIRLTNEQVKGILQNIFGAGADTTYITLEWAMAELVKNPNLMKKLQAEVRGAAKSREKVEEEEINNMPYLKAVIKEVMRLHPSVPLLLPHHSMEDTFVQGYFIPKETKVFINAWAIGRDPRYWDSPEEFRPERFMDNDVDFKGNCFQFIPFSAGRRICPGMNFAVAVIELALASLVHVFDWELPSGLSCEDFDMNEVVGLTMRKRDNLQLVAKLRMD